MANYTGAGRSNYFKVKDEEAFLKWAEAICLEVWKGSDYHKDMYAFCGDHEAGLLPSSRTNDDGTILEDVDLFAELAEHLADGQVAVFIHAGHEKLRVVGGYATAVNSKGELLNLDLSEIYDLVHIKWGIDTTVAEY